MACAIGLSRILREDRATKDGLFADAGGFGHERHDELALGVKEPDLVARV